MAGTSPAMTVRVKMRTIDRLRLRKTTPRIDFLAASRCADARNMQVGWTSSDKPLKFLISRMHGLFPRGRYQALSMAIEDPFERSRYSADGLRMQDAPARRPFRPRFHHASAGPDGDAAARGSRRRSGEGRAARARTCAPIPRLGRDSVYFALLNRGKKSVTLDLKNPADRAALAPLVARADNIVEQFRPGVMARLGLGPADIAAINPRRSIARSPAMARPAPRARSRGTI